MILLKVEKFLFSKTIVTEILNKYYLLLPDTGQVAFVACEISDTRKCYLEVLTNTDISWLCNIIYFLAE